MASIFRRMFKVAESNAHAAIDHLEDPIKMTEQGIRDLKKNLQAAMVSLAQVKSLAIRMQKEAGDHKRRAAEYERKAMLLLKRVEAGEMDAGEAERLATAALRRRRTPCSRRSGWAATTRRNSGWRISSRPRSRTSSGRSTSTRTS